MQISVSASQPQRFCPGWHGGDRAPVYCKGPQVVLGAVGSRANGGSEDACLHSGTQGVGCRVSRPSRFPPATGLVKDAARPAYWVPDHEILHCHNCRKEFSIKLSKHHCRACGQGFCDECSHDRRAVPSRGWDHPVRVCFNCNKKPGDL